MNEEACKTCNREIQGMWNQERALHQREAKEFLWKKKIECVKWMKIAIDDCERLRIVYRLLCRMTWTETSRIVWDVNMQIQEVAKDPREVPIKWQQVKVALPAPERVIETIVNTDWHSLFDSDEKARHVKLKNWDYIYSGRVI